MGNTISHYFGAYLEVKVKKQTSNNTIRKCQNGLVATNVSQFCGNCGLPFGLVTETTEEYATQLWDLLGEDWDEWLSVITPPSYSGRGTIIAIANRTGKEGGEWLVLDEWYDGQEIKEFPTNKEVVEMRRMLLENYKKSIEDIERLDVVEFVEIKAGYVLDAEY